jgi:hypothetical protein
MYRICLSIVLSIILIGCGGGDTPDLVTVEGTVTLDGKALPNATVEFTPSGEEGGRPSIAVTDESGDYELQYTAANAGAPPGKYTVRITTATTTTDEQGNDVDVPETLPAKYNVETELEKEVKAGANTFDFSLDRDGEVYEESDDEGNGDDSAPSC